MRKGKIDRRECKGNTGKKYRKRCRKILIWLEMETIGKWGKEREEKQVGNKLKYEEERGKFVRESKGELGKLRQENTMRRTRQN